MSLAMSAAEYRALAEKKRAQRRHKFNARAVKKGDRADGLTFPTQHEAKRYDALRVLENIGHIVAGSIRLQVRYRLDVNGEHVCDYIADFVYRLPHAPDVDVVEDAKGVRTDVYKIKKALMRACLGIDVLEIGEERKRKPKRRPRRNRKT